MLFSLMYKMLQPHRDRRSCLGMLSDNNQNNKYAETSGYDSLFVPLLY